MILYTKAPQDNLFAVRHTLTEVLKMTAIGIDIGTTTVCAIAIDSGSGEVLHSITRPNPGVCDTIGIQKPDIIITECTEMTDELIAKFGNISSIGISGQMHGIVYLDASGRSVSPLFTWQFPGANEEHPCGGTYAERLSRDSGYAMSTGFGLSTYYLHSLTGCVPTEASACCTIHDYFALSLCKNSKPIIHASDAASFGMFDFAKMDFDKAAVTASGMNADILPEVISNFETIGHYRGIPVCVAGGDNQMSFIGSVCDIERCVLVNVGTGSQVSFASRRTDQIAGTELRPCCGNVMLRVGSALCGGMAFAALEKFIRECADLAGADCKSAYACIDKYLKAPEPPEPLRVSTRFEGTRENPDERGFIADISLNNFTPGHLIWGVIHSMADELYEMYDRCGEERSILVGSGNGLRKNPALQRTFESLFGLEMHTPQHKEEAAFGAALCGLYACGEKKSLKEAQELIKY